MLTNGVKILLALFLLLILTGCSATEKKNMINKKPLSIQKNNYTYSNEAKIVQLSNGTYIYHDRAYPGL